MVYFHVVTSSPSKANQPGPSPNPIEGLDDLHPDAAAPALQPHTRPVPRVSTHRSVMCQGCVLTHIIPHAEMFPPVTFFDVKVL